MPHADIDRAAPLTTRHEIEIQASADTVWRILTDIDRWSQWHPDISMAKLKGELEEGAKFRWKSGGFSIKSTIEEMEPGRRIVWSGKGWGIRAVQAWTLKPSADGVQLVIEESLRGWMPRLFKRAMLGSMNQGLESWLRNLKFKAEHADRPSVADPDATPASAPGS